MASTKRILTIAATAAGMLTLAWQPLAAPALTLPNRTDTVKFAVIGDNGTGSTAQFELARQMVTIRAAFPFDLVIMVGDNFYGSQTPAELDRKFAQPYRLLLDAGVRFQAAIGNHDEPRIVNYPPLNMGGQRYYTYTRRDVRFFVLDTNVMDAPQLRWFEQALQAATEPWKIAYFHHPLYGNAGRHGSAVDLRVLLEPLLVRHGVAVVFSGHDHVYERVKPQKGIHYFVAGSSGQLRKGDLVSSPTSAAGFDRDQTFLVVEVDTDTLFFEAISRGGVTVDSGVIPRPRRTNGTM
jgi:hypothetical protein